MFKSNEMDESVKIFIELGERINKLLLGDVKLNKQKEAKDLKEWIQEDGLESMKASLIEFLQGDFTIPSITVTITDPDGLLGGGDPISIQVPATKSPSGKILTSTVLDLRKAIAKQEGIHFSVDIDTIGRISDNAVIPLEDNTTIFNGQQFEVKFAIYGINVKFRNEEFRIGVPIIATAENWEEAIVSQVDDQDLNAGDPFDFTYTIDGQNIHSESNKKRRLWDWVMSIEDPVTGLPPMLIITP